MAISTIFFQAGATLHWIFSKILAERTVISPYTSIIVLTPQET